MQIAAAPKNNILTSCLTSALLIGVLSSPSYAAVYHYRYTGNPLRCEIDDADCLEIGANGLIFSGGIAIDEGLFPGGSISGSSLFLENELLEDVPQFTPYHRISYTVMQGGNEFSGSKLTFRGRQIFPFLRSLMIKPSGEEIVLDTLFAPVYGTSFYGLTFGIDRQITSWAGYSGLAGGSNDYSTSGNYFTGGGEDYNAGGESAPQGTWRLSYVGPSPVPLPASLPLLATGVVGLWFWGRRKNRKTN